MLPALEPRLIPCRGGTCGHTRSRLSGAGIDPHPDSRDEEGKLTSPRHIEVRALEPTIVAAAPSSADPIHLPSPRAGRRGHPSASLELLSNPSRREASTALHSEIERTYSSPSLSQMISGGKAPKDLFRRCNTPRRNQESFRCFLACSSCKKRGRQNPVQDRIETLPDDPALRT